MLDRLSRHNYIYCFRLPKLENGAGFAPAKSSAQLFVCSRRRKPQSASRKACFHICARSVALAAAVLTLFVLIIRGCVMSRSPLEAAPKPVVLSSGRSLCIYNDETCKIETIELKTYLVGVVAGEMPASFELEALKAQAVAARTYTLWRVENRPCERHSCDICTDSKCCQAYCSEAYMRQKWGSSNYEAFSKKLRLAVEATCGETLLYNGEYIEALFHSSAGGQTEDSEHVYACARPYLRSVESPERGADAATQTLSFTAREFARAVNSEYPQAQLSSKLSKLKNQVKVLSRFDSGRVEALKLGGATLTGRELRSLLELRSANFTINFTSDEIQIATVGYGHGVGMSQRGANIMAMEGAEYSEILLHYYTGVEIKRK